MPVYNVDGKNVLFVHIPKCGGTTIEYALSDYLVGFLDRKFKGDYFPCSPQHFHKELLESILNIAYFDLVFTIVRNPYDRIVSEYKWRKKYGNFEKTFDVWLKQQLDCVIENPYHLDNHLRPMTDFMLPRTEIFRLEDGMGPAFEHISAVTGASFDAQAAKRNVMSSTNEQIEMTADSKYLIQEYYMADLNVFGYQCP